MTDALIALSPQVSLLGSSGSPNINSTERAIVSHQQERKSSHR